MAIQLINTTTKVAKHLSRATYSRTTVNLLLAELRKVLPISTAIVLEVINAKATTKSIHIMETQDRLRKAGIVLMMIQKRISQRTYSTTLPINS